MKAAARRTGLPPETYAARVEAGEKWCTRCKAWHPRSDFGEDRSRSDGLTAMCRRSKYRPVAQLSLPIGRRVGWLKPARCGDKKQARARVNYLVANRRLPEPNSLPCADCGHVWTEGERRHEYDHHQGYDAAHQLDVQSVCTTCHHKREARRG